MRRELLKAAKDSLCSVLTSPDIDTFKMRLVQNAAFFEHLRYMESVVARMTEGITSGPRTFSTQPDKEFVLITGTTGDLGSRLLVELIAAPRVEKIYAFNRGDLTALLDRQEAAIQVHSKHVDLRSEVARGRVVLLSGDMTIEDGWGVDRKVFDQVNNSLTFGIPLCANLSPEQMKKDVTLIIHNGSIHPWEILASLLG